MNRFSSLVLTALGLSLAPSSAAAQEIVYQFQGEVIDVSLGPSTTWPGLASGDPAALSLTVDTSTPGNPASGLPSTFYAGAITSASLTMGGTTVTNSLSGDLTVFDELGAACLDGVSFSLPVAPGWDAGSPNFDLSSSGCPNADFVSQDIPTSLPAGAVYPRFINGLFDLGGGVILYSIQLNSGGVLAPGDDCADPIVLPSGFGTTAYDATGATTDGLAADGFCDYGPNGDEQNYNDIWFTYTPDVGGCTYITTYNLAGYDTRLTVYEGNVCPDDPATIIACVDDEEFPIMTPYEAGLDVDLVAGQIYTIRLGTYNATTAAGPGAISITSGAGANVLSGGNNPGAPGCVPPPLNDDCGMALAVGLGTHPFDTRSATDGAGSPLDPMVCDMGLSLDEQIYQDAWFSFTPASTDFHDFEITNPGTAFDSRIAIYAQAGCPDDPMSVIACDDDSGGMGRASAKGVLLTSGAPYLVRVGSAEPTTVEQLGELTISIGLAPPANDDCVNAIALPSTFADTAYDATGATTDGFESTGFCDYGDEGDEQNYHDVWFSFTPESTSCYYVSTLNLAGYDTRLTVYLGDSCPAAPASIVACVDDEILPPTTPYEAGLDVQMQAGMTYLIRLGTFSSGVDAGSGTLRVAQGPGADPSGSGNPGIEECPDFTYEVESGTAQPGGTVTLTVDLDARQGPMDGFAFGLQVPPPLEIVDWVPSATVNTSNGGAVPDFDQYNIVPGLGVEASVVIDFFGMNKLPADENIEMGHLTVRVPESIPTGTLLPLVFGDVSGPSQQLIAVVGGAILPAETFGGAVLVEYPSSCFGDGGDQMGCTDCPCMNNATPGSGGGCAHSASGLFGGAGSRLIASGSPSVSLPFDSTDDLQLSMENMPPTSTAVMFSGSAVAPQNAMNPCFGMGVAVDLMAAGAKDGLRCAVGGLLRHGNRQSDTMGNIMNNSGPSRTWGGTAGPPAGLAAQVGFMAGQTRYFQATHRDLDTEQCMTGLNTSQAVEVSFTP